MQLLNILGLKYSHTCHFIRLNLNVGSWNCVTGVTKHLFNPCHMFNTERGRKDTTGHKMQPLSSRGLTASRCASRQSHQCCTNGLGLDRQTVVLAEWGQLAGGRYESFYDNIPVCNVPKSGDPFEQVLSASAFSPESQECLLKPLLLKWDTSREHSMILGSTNGSPGWKMNGWLWFGR